MGALATVKYENVGYSITALERPDPFGQGFLRLGPRFFVSEKERNGKSWCIFFL